MKKEKIRTPSLTDEELDRRVYRLKISLQETDPCIWRRVEVYAGMELDSLAAVIETVFGWSGDHMAELEIKGCTYGDEDGWVGTASEDVPPVLRQIVPRVRTKFTYRYDFGDDWKHLIEVEKIAPAEPGVRYPRCTDGARAHPIEDCGGPWGFADLVEAVGDPKHERYGDLVEWGLKKWNPAVFSLERVNRDLARVFRLRK
jgi:hypothetical protein